jgi:flagellar biosynthesis/type III secretory pathway protein FliH
VDDAALSSNGRLKGGLLALKLANEDDPARLEVRVRAVLVHLLSSTREGDSALRSFLVYAHHALGFDAVPLLREVVRELAPEKEREMISAAEHYIAQGLQQGLAQGMEKGMEKGIAQGVETGRVRTLRSVLTRLLAKRFGPLAPDLEASIAAADAETLERWHDRAIDSPTLDAVTR